MTASGDLAVPDPKPMEGQTTFFTGTLGVDVMLAKSDVAWRTPGKGEAAPGGGRGRGGEFGGGRRGGGRGPRGEGGGPGGEGGDRRPPGSEAARGPAIRAENAPPVQLRLRLTNHGKDAVEVEVLDFNSSLGNFVVQPAVLVVAAESSTETDPMTSRLGVPALEEIPITVRIRVGGKSGRSETQVVKLRPRADDPAPAKPAP